MMRDPGGHTFHMRHIGPREIVMYWASRVVLHEVMWRVVGVCGTLRVIDYCSWTDENRGNLLR